MQLYLFNDTNADVLKKKIGIFATEKVNIKTYCI